MTRAHRSVASGGSSWWRHRLPECTSPHTILQGLCDCQYCSELMKWKNIYINVYFMGFTLFICCFYKGKELRCRIYTGLWTAISSFSIDISMACHSRPRPNLWTKRASVANLSRGVGERNTASAEQWVPGRGHWIFMQLASDATTFLHEYDNWNYTEPRNNFVIQTPRANRTTCGGRGGYHVI